MSSTANPYGMIPVENYGADYNTQGFETVGIADGYNTSIFFGDVVKLVAGGTVEKDVGTTTLTPYGVFLGVEYIDPSLGYLFDSNFWPASTTTGYSTWPKMPRARILTFPKGVFQIQADGSVPMSARGANAAIVQTAGSAAGFGKSRNALSASSIDTTNTLPLRIVDIIDSPTNAWGDAYTDVLVTWNAGVQINNTTGV